MFELTNGAQEAECLEVPCKLGTLPARVGGKRLMKRA